MWQSPSTWILNCSDLFGARVYASSRKEAISVVVDKLLDAFKAGDIRSCVWDDELAATVELLDMRTGAVEVAAVDVAVYKAKEATVSVGKTLLLETFDAPKILVRPTPMTIMPNSETSIVARYSYRFRP